MAVISTTNFDTVFIDDVSTAALNDAVWRENFELVFLAFSKSHIRNYRLVETDLMIFSFKPVAGYKSYKICKVNITKCRGSRNISYGQPFVSE